MTVKQVYNVVYTNTNINMFFFVFFFFSQIGKLFWSYLNNPLKMGIVSKIVVGDIFLSVICL